MSRGEFVKRALDRQVPIRPADDGPRGRGVIRAKDRGKHLAHGSEQGAEVMPMEVFGSYLGDREQRLLVAQECA